MATIQCTPYSVQISASPEVALLQVQSLFLVALFSSIAFNSVSVVLVEFLFKFWCCLSHDHVLAKASALDAGPDLKDAGTV